MINLCCTYCREIPRPSVMMLHFHFLKCIIYLFVLLNIVYKAIQGMNGKLYFYILALVAAELEYLSIWHCNSECSSQ